MIARIVLVMALVVGLAGCGRILVGAEGSPSGLDHWAVGIKF